MTVYKGYKYSTRPMWHLKHTLQGYSTYYSPQFNPRSHPDPPNVPFRHTGDISYWYDIGDHTGMMSLCGFYLARPPSQLIMRHCYNLHELLARLGLGGTQPM